MRRTHPPYTGRRSVHGREGFIVPCFPAGGDPAVYAQTNRFADVSVASNGDTYVVGRLSKRIRIITKEG